MTDVSLKEIHHDIEILKRDVAEIKAAVLGEECELTDLAKSRVETYLSKGARKVVSQEEVEKRFL